MGSYGSVLSGSGANKLAYWLAKGKNNLGETWDIGDDLQGFESLVPGQSAVNQELYNALVNALAGEFPEEYFQSSVAEPARRTFNEETAPAIREEFAGPGTYWGTARANRVTGGRENMERNISAGRNEMAYQTQQQALQAALAYLGIPLLATYQPYDKNKKKSEGTKGYSTGIINSY